MVLDSPLDAVSLLSESAVSSSLGELVLEDAFDGHSDSW